MDTFFHRVSNHCFLGVFTVLISDLQRGVRNPFYTFLEVLLFLDLVLENYLSFNEPRFIGLPFLAMTPFPLGGARHRANSAP